MKRFFAFILVLVLVLGMVGCGGSKKLTKDEERALSIVQDLVDSLKDPDSFKLRDDVLVIYNPEKSDPFSMYVYIDYSANNSYGASIRSIAVYHYYEYLGDLKNENDNKIGMPSARALYEEYQNGTLEDESFINASITVKSSVIIKNLK